VKLVWWVDLILSSLLSQGFVEEVRFKSWMEEASEHWSEHSTDVCWNGRGADLGRV